VESTYPSATDSPEFILEVPVLKLTPDSKQSKDPAYKTPFDEAGKGRPTPTFPVKDVSAAKLN
jgi:hypothetical protein